jgi:hypothetical protein
MPTLTRLDGTPVPKVGTKEIVEFPGKTQDPGRSDLEGGRAANWLRNQLALLNQQEARGQPLATMLQPSQVETVRSPAAPFIPAVPAQTMVTRGQHVFRGTAPVTPAGAPRPSRTILGLELEASPSRLERARSRSSGGCWPKPTAPWVSRAFDEPGCRLIPVARGRSLRWRMNRSRGGKRTKTWDLRLEER